MKKTITDRSLTEGRFGPIRKQNLILGKRVIRGGPFAEKKFFSEKIDQGGDPYPFRSLEKFLAATVPTCGTVLQPSLDWDI